MQTVGRLTSDGIMRVYGNLDEFSFSGGDNVRMSGVGTFYSSLFDENLSLELSSNTPLRIKDNKNVVVYNYFDEYTLSLSDQEIFGNIVFLSSALSASQNITNTNLGTIQGQIQSYNSAFNVFAVVSDNKNSESLQGVNSSSGRITFTAPNFAYNTSNSNILSTGKTIADMTGGDNYGLPFIDGKKWMAMSVFDGTTSGFLGTLLWIFTNNTINSSNVVTTDGKIVTNTASIFYPVLPDLSYMQIYQVVISPQGTILYSNISSTSGWSYSSNQQATSAGYYSTTKFSFDDGLWAQIINGKTSGNAGPDYRTASGYGLGNFNSTDPNSRLYWNGIDKNTTNYVGFVFTGDA